MAALSARKASRGQRGAACQAAACISTAAMVSRTRGTKRSASPVFDLVPVVGPVRARAG
jgi:hypothetical protein